MTFSATAGVPYHLWLRGRAEADHYWNDSLFVQFDGSVTVDGRPTWRIGTTSATTVVLEDCSGCALQGWGWADNGYGTLGPAVYFAQTGPQKIRIQVREDGMSLDQIVISPSTYLNTAPGAVRNDNTIVQKGG